MYMMSFSVMGHRRTLMANLLFVAITISTCVCPSIVLSMEPASHLLQCIYVYVYLYRYHAPAKTLLTLRVFPW